MEKKCGYHRITLPFQKYHSYINYTGHRYYIIKLYFLDLSSLRSKVLSPVPIMHN